MSFIWLRDFRTCPAATVQGLGLLFASSGEGGRQTRFHLPWRLFSVCHLGFSVAVAAEEPTCQSDLELEREKHQDPSFEAVTEFLGVSGGPPLPTGPFTWEESGGVSLCSPVLKFSPLTAQRLPLKWFLHSRER